MIRGWTGPQIILSHDQRQNVALLQQKTWPTRESHALSPLLLPLKRPLSLSILSIFPSPMVSVSSIFIPKAWRRGMWAECLAHCRYSVNICEKNCGGTNLGLSVHKESHLGDFTQQKAYESFSEIGINCQHMVTWYPGHMAQITGLVVYLGAWLGFLVQAHNTDDQGYSVNMPMAEFMMWFHVIFHQPCYPVHR